MACAALLPPSPPPTASIVGGGLVRDSLFPATPPTPPPPASHNSPPVDAAAAAVLSFSLTLLSLGSHQTNGLTTQAASLLDVAPPSVNVSSSSAATSNELHVAVHVSMCTIEAARLLLSRIATLNLDDATSAFGTQVLEISEARSTPPLPDAYPPAPPAPADEHVVVVSIIIAVVVVLVGALLIVAVIMGRRASSMARLRRRAQAVWRRHRIAQALPRHEREAALAAARTLPASLLTPSEVRLLRPPGCEVEQDSGTEIKLVESGRSTSLANSSRDVDLVEPAPKDAGKREKPPSTRRTSSRQAQSTEGQQTYITAIRL